VTDAVTDAVTAAKHASGRNFLKVLADTECSAALLVAAAQRMMTCHYSNVLVRANCRTHQKQTTNTTRQVHVDVDEIASRRAPAQTPPFDI
jgi:hypothetical protein